MDGKVGKGKGKLCSSVCSGIVFWDMEEEHWVGRNPYLLHTIPRLGKEWTIQFDMKLLHVKELQDQSILTISNGSWKDVLSVWTLTKGGETKLYSATRKSISLPSSPLPLNAWISIKISHRLEGGKYICKVAINGKLAASFENRHVHKPELVKVFAGHPLRENEENADSSLRHLILKTGQLLYFLVELNSRHLHPALVKSGRTLFLLCS